MNRSSGGGVGFFGVLTLIFIVLKLVGTVAWSWFSFNPFEWTVLIFVTWSIYLVLIGAVIGIIYLSFSGKEEFTKGKK